MPAALRMRLGQRRRRKRSPASSWGDEDVSPAHSLTSFRKERSPAARLAGLGDDRSLLHPCLPREPRGHPLDICRLRPALLLQRGMPHLPPVLVPCLNSDELGLVSAKGILFSKEQKTYRFCPYMRDVHYQSLRGTMK